MTEPQRYLADIPGGLKHVHRAAMPQNMRRYWLGGKRGHDLRRNRGVLCQDIFEAGARHRPAGLVEEERGVAILGSDRDPGPDRGGGLLPERQHALPPSLPDNMDAGRRPSVELVEGETNKFGNAQPAGEGEMQHCPIANARWCPPVRCVEQRLNFGARKGSDQRLVDLLHGNGVHPKGLIENRGDAVLEIAEEGLHGRQPCVARTSLVAARLRAYAERIEIRQEGRLVGDHPRHFGRDRTIYNPWHYVPVLLRKPGALHNGAPFKDWVLPGALEQIRRKLQGSSDGDRQMVKILGAVLTEGMPAVQQACP